MRNNRGLLGLMLALALVAAACGGGDDATTETTEAPTTTAAPATTEAPTTTTTAAPEPETLVIWADENRAKVMEQVAPTFEDAAGVNVEIQIVDFGEIRSQVQTAAPAGEGPDIFIGAADWSGELAANGVAAPLDLGSRAGEFEGIALDLFTFDGALYALPYATEAIAMYYNMDLVSEPPAAFEDIEGICAGLSGIENCVGVPGGGDGPDAYHNYPFVSAQGGYIFPFEAGAGFDPSDVGLNSEGAIQGVKFLEEQIAAGVVDSVNYDGAKQLFLDGTQPFWITGPWELGNLADSGINWSVAKLPTIGGSSPQPFAGGQGFYLSTFSENPVLAQSFLFDFIATPETMQALYDADPRNPAHTPTLEANSDNEVLQTFAASAADGVPIPNVPEMGSVWGPLGDNLLAVRNGDKDATTAMNDAQTAVEEALAG